MRTLFLLQIILIAIPLFSQNEIQPTQIITQTLEWSGNWGNNKIELFEYDESGNPIFILSRKFNRESKTWKDHRRTIRTYNNEGFITSHRSQILDSIENWTDFLIEEYNYNGTGCLSKKTTIQTYLSGTSKKLLEYRYKENCLIDTIFLWETGTTNEPNPTLKLRETTIFNYENNGLKAIEWLREHHPAGGLTFNGVYRIHEYNSAGERTSLAFPENIKYEYEYYPDGALKNRIVYYWLENNWVYNGTLNYEHIINENNLTTSIIENSFDTTSIFPTIFGIENFEYFCDGLLRTKTSTFSKKIYFYDVPSECFDISKEGIDILVYPNPATQYIQIYSKALQSGSLTASIFDSKGSMVFQQKMEGRAEGLDIDVRDYVPGIYFVNLTGEGKTKTEKILIKP